MRKLLMTEPLVLIWWRPLPVGLAGSRGSTLPQMVLAGPDSLLLLLLLFPLCLAPPVPPLGQIGEGLTEPQGLQRQLCGKHTMPSLPSGHSLTQLCPSSDFSGSKTKARVAQFLFSGHWKNSGLISPSSLLFSYLGTLGFLEAQELWPGTTGL